MQALISKLVVFACLLLAFPLIAEEQDAVDSALEMARVVTDSKLPSDCLAPVAIRLIDGEQLRVSDKSFLLEPGVHSLSGLVTLDTSKCRVLEADIDIVGNAGLELQFEAGKTYFIAYDRSSSDTQDWKLVVWKEEQASLETGFSSD